MFSFVNCAIQPAFSGKKGLAESPSYADFRRFDTGTNSIFTRLVQCRGDAVEHGQRMSLVIGILETADDGRRCADKFGQMPLGQPGGGAEVINFAGDVIVCAASSSIASISGFPRKYRSWMISIASVVFLFLDMSQLLRVQCRIGNVDYKALLLIRHKNDASIRRRGLSVEVAHAGEIVPGVIEILVGDQAGVAAGLQAGRITVNEPLRFDFVEGLGDLGDLFGRHVADDEFLAGVEAFAAEEAPTEGRDALAEVAKAAIGQAAVEDVPALVQRGDEMALGAIDGIEFESFAGQGRVIADEGEESIRFVGGDRVKGAAARHG